MKNTQTEDLNKITEIINKIKVCHIGFVDGDKPYVLPFNFVYRDSILYIHSALTGRKIDILKKNNNVCASFETDSKLFVRHEQVACSYSMTFKSVVMSGKLEFIEDNDEKSKIMNWIMDFYTGKSNFKYNLPAITNVAIMKIIIENATARIRE